VLGWPSADQMRHLKTFVLSQGTKYQELAPASELVSPSRYGPAEAYVGWAYCAATPDREFLLVYFEKECPRASLSGLLPQRAYKSRWFDPRSGAWSDAGEGTLTADAEGRAAVPPFPGGKSRSQNDWGLSLTPAD